MKSPARYKVDLSKRLSGREQKAWYEQEEVLPLILKTAKVMVVALAILYPWIKYQGVYLPLKESISGKQAEIAKLNTDTARSGKKLEELVQHRKQISHVRLERQYWSDKLLNLPLWVPDKVFITEISLREAANDSQKQSGKRSFVMHGLTPILEKGEYIAKLVALTQRINCDQVFTKNFQPIQLNYTKQIKVSQKNLSQPVDMVEFELEAEAK